VVSVRHQPLYLQGRYPVLIKQEAGGPERKAAHLENRKLSCLCWKVMRIKVINYGKPASISTIIPTKALYFLSMSNNPTYVSTAIDPSSGVQGHVHFNIH
jgi:hypothetical protein